MNWLWNISSLGAAAAALGLACAGAPGEAPIRVSRPFDPAAVLSEAIRRPTVNPPGDEEPLARFLVGLLRAAGLEAQVIQTPRGKSQVGRAAAWGRRRGTGAARPIVLLSHLDVVPADRAAWSGDPFGGDRHDGLVFGRGALDAKGVAVVHMLTLVELERRGIPLRRDVIFLATPDEETGGRDGAGYLVREQRRILRGAEYLLTEGGGVMLSREGRPSVWGVAITEKSPCWLRVIAEGTPGHSSVPPPDAAVPRLVAALDLLRRVEMPIRVIPEVERMFAALAPLAPPDDAAGYAQLAEMLDADSAFRSRFLSHRAYRALVRDTLTITVLQGSSRTNVVPRRAIAHLDARLLPGASCEIFADRMRGVINDPGVRIEIILAFPSRSSPVDTDLFTAIERVAERLDPGAVVAPRVVAGFTDAHYFRDIGIDAYGFVPRWQYADEMKSVHGPNERVSVDNLERGIETMIAILQELDRSDR